MKWLRIKISLGICVWNFEENKHTVDENYNFVVAFEKHVVVEEEVKNI
jgi:hypothetical protein